MAFNLSKKIDDLSLKLAQLKAQKQQADSLQRARSIAANRKTETRRKILLGAFVLDQIGTDGAEKLNIYGRLFDEWLVKPNDRALFGLSPSTSEQTSAAHATHPSTGGEV